MAFTSGLQYPKERQQKLEKDFFFFFLVTLHLPEYLNI
jgi:hypothetical protein